MARSWQIDHPESNRHQLLASVFQKLTLLSTDGHCTELGVALRTEQISRGSSTKTVFESRARNIYLATEEAEGVYPCVARIRRWPKSSATKQAIAHAHRQQILPASFVSEKKCAARLANHEKAFRKNVLGLCRRSGPGAQVAPRQRSPSARAGLHAQLVLRNVSRFRWETKRALPKSLTKNASCKKPCL